MKCILTIKKIGSRGHIAYISSDHSLIKNESTQLFQDYDANKMQIKMIIRTLLNYNLV